MSTDPVMEAALRGDSTAFRALVDPHLPALHLHSYRMLGSHHDAEDAVQETLLRAWQGLAGYEGRAPLRHWLFRITTTTCLKAIERRRRTPVTDSLDVTWLEPCPDVLLDRLDDPADLVDRRESVALAFIAALQLLPATQRAVLILRDVLAWPAAEVAGLLGTSAAAVNSALQRARATLAASTDVTPVTRPAGERERHLVTAFLRAWADCDVDALARLLREDVILTMPPERIRITGRDAVARFFATVPAGGRLDLVDLVETRANGQVALAAYLPGDSAGLDCHGYGIMVLTLDTEGIAAITGFPGPGLFPVFGLPTARVRGGR
ncbi:RNA polymerase subunit sigma-70 [Actinoplanes sp. NPDC051861]|uniref:RNA polymerase subunit sigma-70 n=1 Tax=Actinoplanes sp. NPDC051861 TaxID=3155170 RepID=UPI00343E66FB